MKKIIAYLVLAVLAAFVVAATVEAIAARQDNQRLFDVASMVSTALLVAILCAALVFGLTTGKLGGGRLPAATRERQPIWFWFQTATMLAIIAVMVWATHQLWFEWRQMG